MQIILGPIGILFFFKHEALFCDESNWRVVYLIRLGKLIDVLVPYSVDIMSYVYIP
jgi:hypothetical protein